MRGIFGNDVSIIRILPASGNYIMKSTIKMVIIVVLGFACTKQAGQKNTPAPTDGDSLVYALVKLVLTDTSMYGKQSHRILSEMPSLPPPNNYDGTYATFVSRILSERDTTCIFDQLKGSGNFLMGKMEKYGFTIVNLDSFQTKFVTKGTFWDRFYEKYGDGFLSVSKPILNCEKTKVFIRVAYMCGNECGGGSDLVLEQFGSSWVLKEEISSWVS
jgi:hypothetical protein